MIAWIVLILIVLCAVIESLSYAIYRTNRNVREIARDMLGKKRPPSSDIETFMLRYAEHPFLGYALNPEFRNSFGEAIHNTCGFRFEGDLYNLDGTVVYCAGDSSTYCNGIERNKDTWPALLQNALRTHPSYKEAVVVNGGCGAWTSFQSLIRFLTWVDVIRPQLVIVYHGKTDFIPFMAGDASVRKIFPDYSNIMCSLRMGALARAWGALARFSYAGKIAYGAYVNTAYENIHWKVLRQKKAKLPNEIRKGLRRVTPEAFDFIFSRYRSFVDACVARKIPILLVTQRVASVLYRPYMSELNDRIRSLACAPEGVYVYDFDREASGADRFLFDSVHFTHEGVRFFSERLRDFICSQIIPPLRGKARETSEVLAQGRGGTV